MKRLLNGVLPRLRPATDLATPLGLTASLSLRSSGGGLSTSARNERYAMTCISFLGALGVALAGAGAVTPSLAAPSFRPLAGSVGLDTPQLTLSSPVNGRTISYREGDVVSVPMTIRFTGDCSGGPPSAARIYQTASNNHPAWHGGYITQLPPSLIGVAKLSDGSGTYIFRTVAAGDSSAANPLYWQGLFAVVDCDGLLSSNSIDTHEVAPGSASGARKPKKHAPIRIDCCPPIPQPPRKVHGSPCSQFAITTRGFRPSEQVTAVEQRPDAAPRTLRLVATQQGVARVLVGGCGQQRGVHRWTFTGNRSGRRVHVSYAVD
jgi:hypothetical protein